MVGYNTDGVITLLPKPDGYDVDFDHPQQQKALEHYLVFGIGGPLALIALLQRYYTKIWLSKGLQVDDGKYKTMLERLRYSRTWNRLG